jgi:hypothetical protein
MMMIYLLSILFTLTFVLYTRWQFSDDRGLSSGKWHPYGMLMRALAIVTPFLCTLHPNNWKDYLLAGGINIVLWEILINKIALNTKWSHVGTTSALDVKFGKAKWYIYFGFLLLTIIIRLI